MRIAVLSKTQCVVNHDSRVYREATTLQKAGHEVLIIGAVSHDKEDLLDTEYESIRVHRVLVNWRDFVRHVKPPWLRIPVYIVRPLFLPFVINYISAVDYSYKAYQVLKEFKPDVVHGHDLPTMPLAYWCKRNLGSSIVYDNHELWLNRNTAVPMRRIWGTAEYALEKFIVKRVDSILTVNDSLTDIMNERYGIKATTLLNYPIPPQSPFASLHFCNDIPTNKKIILYLGLITPNRGVEQAISAMVYLPDHVLVLMGYYLDITYPERLNAHIMSEGVHDRVKFMDAVPYNYVTSYAQSADIGIMLIRAACTSYQYCFPNKLLESTAAGIPVVVNKNTIDVANFVEKHCLGLAVDPNNSLEVAKAITTVSSNPAYRDHAKELSSQISWESQAKKLLEIYDRIGKEKDNG